MYYYYSYVEVLELVMKNSAIVKRFGFDNILKLLKSIIIDKRKI